MKNSPQIEKLEPTAKTFLGKLAAGTYLWTRTQPKLFPFLYSPMLADFKSRFSNSFDQYGQTTFMGVPKHKVFWWSYKQYHKLYKRVKKEGPLAGEKSDPCVKPQVIIENKLRLKKDSKLLNSNRLSALSIYALLLGELQDQAIEHYADEHIHWLTRSFKQQYDITLQLQGLERANPIPPECGYYNPEEDDEPGERKNPLLSGFYSEDLRQGQVSFYDNKENESPDIEN